jgi:uncharacterized repeat protein (TIGR03803 family)
VVQGAIRTKEAFIVTNRVYVMTFLVVLVLAALAPAQTFTVLHNFTGFSDGWGPYAGLIQDPAGDLYGTTSLGGDPNCTPGYGYGCGVVFKLDTAGTETVLHSFWGSDGTNPVAPVLRDKAGNIYGTTSRGGSSGYGTVFKIDTAGTETVLYSFTGGPDGCYPYQGVVVDKSGTVFLTTSECGSSGYGTIFKVDSAGRFSLLHSFTGRSSDGAYPWYGHLTMDWAGTLYGVTSGGGAYGNGVLYELSKKGKLTVLHSFAGGSSDGCAPNGSVVQDKAGNFYGTTSFCGSDNYGTIWKVSKNGKETILHNFAGGSSDGCNPAAGVTRDPKGNLYGVTYGCGANNYGALYKLSTSGTLSLLHSLGGDVSSFPTGEVLRSAKGVLFGTTAGFLSYTCCDCGSVWSYAP